MSRFCLCAVTTCTLAVVATCAFATEPATTLREQGDGVRVAAEWEPVTGVLLGWPLKLPRALVIEMAKDVDLYVTVSNKAGRRRAFKAFTEREIDPARLHFMITRQGDGYYLPRDWGPFAVFDARGLSRLVDGRYLDYPCAVAGDSKRLTSLSSLFGLDYIPDDSGPAAVAAELGLPRRELPVALTGGNLFFDGLGTGFASQILIDENAAMGIPSDKFLDILKKELGVVRFHILPNFEGGMGGIQHIDCLLKLLDEERILIKRPPEDHPDYRRVEAIVGELAKLVNPYGRPYTLLRIDTPRYDHDDMANYTNSIIVNRKIFVPLFGIPADQRALKTWRAAMPGYKVFGFALDKNLIDMRYTDAIHCRTRAIWDQKMLRMSHKRLDGRIKSASGYGFEAEIRDYSGAGLIEDRLRLAWRTSGSPKWTDVRLEPAGTPNAFRGMIQGVRAGQTIEYYLSAASRSGRNESLPRTAPKGFYTFNVEAKP
ncbi:MAG TPA: agmatine deiminase family protein [Isosphaeraceae bacterium]|nr:agmatine deiminase family protein [Isosphaeraceae bacterium]